LEKIHPLLSSFCRERGLKCPRPRTIARIIADDPEKMRVFPKKISHFAEKLKELHLTHYHTHPKCPQMNTHVERFNRSIQEEFIDYFSYLLINPDNFNRRLVDYLIFYNTERVHKSFKNKLSPVQFMIQWQEQRLLLNQQANQLLKMPAESNFGWHRTLTRQKFAFLL